MDDRGRDGAHDRDGEPRVVEGGERGEAAISVDEVVEGDRGDEPRLHPFVDQDPVDWKDGSERNSRTLDARDDQRTQTLQRKVIPREPGVIEC